MFNDVMNCKINQAQVNLFICIHKVCTEMIDGRKTIVIICLGETLGENRVPFNDARLIESHKEIRVDLTHGWFKDFL